MSHADDIEDAKGLYDYAKQLELHIDELKTDLAEECGLSQRLAKENLDLRALLDKEGMARAGSQGELMAANRLLHDAKKEAFLDAALYLRGEAAKIPLGAFDTQKGFSSTYNAMVFGAQTLEDACAEKRNDDMACEEVPPCRHYHESVGCQCPCHGA